MTEIRTLTASYVAAFDARDIDAVAGFLADGFALTDPEVSGLTPKANALSYIEGLFQANESLSFKAHRIVVDGNVSAIHFSLTLSETVLDGVDVIVWDGDRMTSMHAYLTPRG